MNVECALQCVNRYIETRLIALKHFDLVCRWEICNTKCRLLGHLMI